MSKVAINKIVLDSSIFNKLFLNENDSVKAIKYIQTINNDGCTILVPSIFLYEVLGVAGYYKCNTKEIYSLLLDYENNNMSVVNPSNIIINKALEIVNSGNLKSGFPSFYDAVYHAIAIQNSCDFITADRKYFEKAKEFNNIKLFSELK